MSVTCLIGDFRILRPAHAANHEESVTWLSRAHAKSESVLKSGSDFDAAAFQRSMERHVRRFGCGAESLASRGHDLEDFRHQDWGRMRIFNLELYPRGAGMDVRMEIFSEIADRALAHFYGSDAQPPDELIHVSCTGYVAPSAAQKRVVALGWQQRVGVTHAYHMGCYASMPALRMAAGFLATPSVRGARVSRGETHARRVDIVHTETCTLHLDPSNHSPEQLVVQSLFADGHIRYSLTLEEERSSGLSAAGPAGGHRDARGLRFLGVQEEIVPGSLGAMGWVLGDHGMRMILAREVPDLIAAALKDFLKRMFAGAGIDPAEAFGKGLFAIHPGGPRIIDKVAELLELTPAQVAASRAALRDYGNMSSATLPHVWARMTDDPGVAPGTLITSLAFGPGLTIYGALLRKV